MRVRVFAIDRPPVRCPVCGLRLESVTIGDRRVVRCARHGAVMMSPDISVRVARHTNIPTRH